MRKDRILFVYSLFCCLSLSSCITTALIVGVHQGMALERNMSKKVSENLKGHALDAAQRDDSLRALSADTTTIKVISHAEGYHFYSGDSLVIVKDSYR